MQANSSLSLKKYIVKNIQFSINESFEFNKDSTIELHPEFTRNIRKIDDNNALVNLIFRIKNEDLSLPFSIEADIEGWFHLENWEQPELGNEFYCDSVPLFALTRFRHYCQCKYITLCYSSYEYKCFV